MKPFSLLIIVPLLPLRRVVSRGDGTQEVYTRVCVRSGHSYTQGRVKLLTVPVDLYTVLLQYERTV